MKIDTRRYAVTPVVVPNGWNLGKAVWYDKGYIPLSGRTFETEVKAQEMANELNAKLGWSKEQVYEIIMSSMFPFYQAKTELFKDD